MRDDQIRTWPAAPERRGAALPLFLALAAAGLTVALIVVSVQAGGLDEIRSQVGLGSQAGVDEVSVSLADPAATPVVASGVEKPSITSVRLWSNGDSTSFFMSVGFFDAMVARGAALTQPEAEYQNGSGLITPEYFDWPAYIRTEMAEKNPNLVVFMIGANDAKFFADPEEYRALVAEAMDLMEAPERRVIWVGQPNSSQEKLAANVPAINTIFQEEAAKRPWVTFVDTWGVTSDDAGNYSQVLPGAEGEGVIARADDGVHLTQAGGKILADAVMAAIGELYAD